MDLCTRLAATGRQEGYVLLCTFSGGGGTREGIRTAAHAAAVAATHVQIDHSALWLLTPQIEHV